IAREASALPRELGSAMHDEPSPDTMSDDGNALDRTTTIAQPAPDSLDDGATLDPGNTIGPSGSLDTIAPDQAPTGALPCRTFSRTAVSETAPMSVSDTGRAARARWIALHRGRLLLD